MTWTQRPDWINVTNDSALTHHATGDGVKDDTVAIQEALTLASAKTATRVTVYLPAGTYLISQTLTWNSGSGGSIGRSIIGDGSQTTLSWSGTAGGTMLLSVGEGHAKYVGIQWQGNNLAATAINHNATTRCIAPLRHFNEAFLNFTGVALNFTGSGSGPWSGEAEIINCLFYKCHYGSQIGLTTGNIYEYQFEQCEFQQCDTGIDSWGNTAQMVYNTHFTGSTITDMYSKLGVRARHCTSNGSKAFFTSPPWSASSANMHVFQDCWVDSWTTVGTGTTSGALQFGDRCQAIVFDCKFTNPPTAYPPINLTNPYSLTNGASNLIVCNNSSPGFSNQTDMVTLSGSLDNVLPLNVAPANPNVGVTTILSSANHVFLDSTPIEDSKNILDVTKSPYSAKNDGKTDVTAALQSAINYAQAANNGTIVYLPVGYYKLASTLNVSGSNYTIAGSIANSHICWTGTDAGAMINVTGPSNVAFRDFILKTDPATAPNTIGIMASGSSNLSIDNVGFWNYTYPAYNMLIHAYYGPGVLLSGLSAGSRVFAEKLEAPLTVHDCGPAEIFIDHLAGGQLYVDGYTQPKTGFLGVNYTNVGVFNKPGSFDMVIDDNQDFVNSDFYNEQTNNSLELLGGSAPWSGRVTIQGFKQQGWNTSTAITVNNFNGWLFYGPQTFGNYNGTDATNPGSSVPTIVTQTGTSPFTLMLPLDRFWETAVPAITTGSSCRLLQLYNTITTTDGTQVNTLLSNVPSTLTTSDLASLSAGLDHLRQLGLEDLKLMCGMPTLVTQPQSTKVPIGQTATFSVTATGTPAPTFQWRRNGVDIPGATSTSYTTLPVSTSDSCDTFQVVITHADEQVTSTSATLIVTGSVTVTAQPQSAAVSVGETVSFTVGAYSDSPIAYQWLKNGTPITGATSAGYTVSQSATTDDGATFSVVMTCANETFTSGTAVLYVCAPPIFEADFSGAGTGTGGTSNIVTLGGSATLVTGTQVVNAISGTSSMGQGNYLEFTVLAAANTTALNLATFTPASSANSIAAWTGTLVSGTTTYTTFNGAFDMFVRPNVVLSGSQTWCRPVDINNRSGNNGLRIILTGLNNGFQFQLISNNTSAFSADGTTWNTSIKTLTLSYPLTTGTVNHIALVMSTSNSTGMVTASLYGAHSGNAIVTSSTANLLGTLNFYANASAIGSSVFSSGTWTMSARTFANWVATNADYDTVRLYSGHPAFLPAISTASSLPTGNPPSITTAPQNAAVCAGLPATFSALAAGAPAPAYQWLCNGTPIASATSSSYTTPATVLGNDGTAYSVIVSNTNGTVTSGTAWLTVLSTYATWQSAHFTAAQLANSAISGPTATPAGDGMSNLLKYAFGLAPFTNGVAQSPVVTTSTLGGSTYLQISYRQRPDAGDIAYDVQVSNDIVNWNSGSAYTVPVSQVNNADGTQTVTVRSIDPLSNQSCQFIRLRITQTQ